MRMITAQEIYDLAKNGMSRRGFISDTTVKLVRRFTGDYLKYIKYRSGLATFDLEKWKQDFIDN